MLKQQNIADTTITFSCGYRGNESTCDSCLWICFGTVCRCATTA